MRRYYYDSFCPPICDRPGSLTGSHAVANNMALVPGNMRNIHSISITPGNMVVSRPSSGIPSAPLIYPALPPVYSSTFVPSTGGDAGAVVASDKPDPKKPDPKKNNYWLWFLVAGVGVYLVTKK